jgi:hypothetical protein
MLVNGTASAKGQHHSPDMVRTGIVFHAMRMRQNSRSNIAVTYAAMLPLARLNPARPDRHI